MIEDKNIKLPLGEHLSKNNYFIASFPILKGKQDNTFRSWTREQKFTIQSQGLNLFLSLFTSIGINMSFPYLMVLFFYTLKQIYFNCSLLGL